MHFADTFLPTAASSGLLATFTWFTMVVAMFALAASVLFSALTRTHVAPEHNTSRVMTGALCLVAAASYYLIQDRFRLFLSATGGAPTLAQTQAAYLAIGQLRYMDWAVTTPLLLVKMFMIVEAKPHKAGGLLALALAGDVFMIVTGYIGDQQIGADGAVLVGPRLVWGAVSTLGYLAVVYALYRVWKDHAPAATPVEQRAFRWMAGTVVTLWGVYPLGYMLVGQGVDLNWVHIAFSVADVVNKAGVGVVAYLCGAHILEHRIDVKSPSYAEHVG